MTTSILTVSLVLARVLLALVFAVAAAAKLVDLKRTRTGIVAFGVPKHVAAGLAIVIPLAELAVAGLLLAASTALHGALGALALLVLFTSAIVWSLARGKAPECHCFGQLHSAPASWKTVARNGVLLALAALVFVDAMTSKPPSAVGWMADLAGAELAALLVTAASVTLLAVVGAAFLSLMRSYGRVLARLDRVEVALADAGISVDEELALPEIGLVPGTPTPFFAATALDGKAVSSETIIEAGTPTLVLFTSPHCGPCSALMPTVARWQQEHGDRLRVIVASTGSDEDVRAEAERHGLTRVLHDCDQHLAELFQANGTPSAVLLAPDGTIASWVASGSEWIEQVVEQVVAEPADEDGLPEGAEAPALELPSLTGGAVPLASLRGRDTLLLFWNPGCGYCRAMRDEVLAWERDADDAHLRLVVVSSGDAESTRAEGFRSLVLLDEDYRAGTAFGAGGTPMAVRLDEEGRVASQVAAGANAVLELAGALAR